MNRAGRSFNSGFTLIEMLLAVAIFAVVSSSLYFSMRTGILMYKRSEEGLRQSHAITFFLNRIDKELKNAFFYLPEPFDGAQERLSFVTLRQSYSDDEDFVDIVKVTYSTNGKSITKETEFLSRKTEVVKEKDILTGVLQDISFTYAYYDPDEEEIEWRKGFINFDNDCIIFFFNIKLT